MCFPVTASQSEVRVCSNIVSGLRSGVPAQICINQQKSTLSIVDSEKGHQSDQQLGSRSRFPQNCVYDEISLAAPFNVEKTNGKLSSSNTSMCSDNDCPLSDVQEARETDDLCVINSRPKFKTHKHTAIHSDAGLPTTMSDAPKVVSAGTKKKFMFDKNKLSSAFKKIKGGPVDKENPKPSSDSCDTKEILSEQESDSSGTGVRHGNQELIPPTSPHPLEFDIPDATRKKHKKEKKKSE